MEKGEKILNLMLKEHAKIFELLNDFNKNSKNADAEKYYIELKKKQENHAFAEEKAIIFLQSEGKVYNEIITILRQHEEISEIMKNIKENLDKKTKNYNESVKKLRDLMKIHVALENKKFYPKLEKDLDPLQKKKVFEEFREVILGNIKI